MGKKKKGDIKSARLATNVASDAWESQGDCPQQMADFRNTGR